MPKTTKMQKVIRHIRGKIRRGTWKVGKKAPSIRTISEHLKVSKSTVRKAMVYLVKKGILENQGTMGFFVISNLSYEKSKNNHYTNLLCHNMKTIRMLQGGGISIGNLIISYSPITKQVTYLNVLVPKEKNINIIDLKKLMEKPLTLKDILRINNSHKREEKKREYEKQKELVQIAHLVHRHKGELGINAEQDPLYR